jgi:Spy/CpxP family protein refolding chaperone
MPLNRKTALLYLAGVFLLGAVAGGAIGYSQAQPRPKFGGPPPKPEDYVRGKCERLTKQLNLTPEQLSKIEPVVRERMEKMRSLNEESHRRVIEALKDSDRKLSEHLDPEQKSKYAEIQAQKLNRGPGWSPWGPGPNQGPGAPPNHHGYPSNPLHKPAPPPTDRPKP